MSCEIEIYSDMFGEALEGLNFDSEIIYSSAKREYSEAIKKAKKYATLGEPDMVRNALRDARKILVDAKNEVIALDTKGNVGSMLLGNLAVVLKFYLTEFIILFLGKAAGIGTVSALDKFVKSGDQITAALALCLPMQVSMIVAVAEQIIAATRTILALYEAIKRKVSNGKSINSNDFNMYYQKIIQSFDILIGLLEMTEKNLMSKAELKHKKNELIMMANKAAKGGDLKTATEALISLIS